MQIKILLVLALLLSLTSGNFAFAELDFAPDEHGTNVEDEMDEGMEEEEATQADKNPVIMQT